MGGSRSAIDDRGGVTFSQHTQAPEREEPASVGFPDLFITAWHKEKNRARRAGQKGTNNPYSARPELIIPYL